MSAPWRGLRLSLLAAVGLNVLGVLGTYSRGGLLALAAMGAVLWLYSRNKLVTGAPPVAGAPRPLLHAG